MREAAPPEAPLDAALGVLERMMEQAERVTLRAWQAAADDDGGDAPPG